jgi:hypothetical protein
LIVFLTQNGTGHGMALPENTKARTILQQFLVTSEENLSICRDLACILRED